MNGFSINLLFVVEMISPMIYGIRIRALRHYLLDCCNISLYYAILNFFMAKVEVKDSIPDASPLPVPFPAKSIVRHAKSIVMTANRNMVCVNSNCLMYDHVF